MFTTSKKQRRVGALDREWHLPISERAAEPHASGRVIRINSTYLELVDGIYSNRGMMSAFGIFGVSLSVFVVTWLFYVVVVVHYLNPYWDRHDASAMLLSTIFPAVIFSLLIAGIVAFNRTIGEWFRYTHYPMRFNRQNRMVYVFRGDGTILEVPWDRAYFTLRVNSQAFGVRTLGICGLVLKDAQTVEEMFVFGYASSSRDDCLRHWEFIRRYMEEGPRAVIDAPGFTYCLPIADKRETLYQGWIALVSKDAWNPIAKWLMLPFHILFFIGRLACRITSKVPMWPADMEVACRIAPGDAYVRDSSTNPAEYR
ncbi:hypothetical protein LMG24238_02427 [Paraburkholderia sediminicola]|uniref:DUF6708 domain-containing protein n=1 Tax=Paraburkholderia sediminicola TaxID=458836 RepID=A0A6J5ARW4_9BURK|nr:DUF6708 domain-containing protein [Paraburkholderia sediminicola]CAB3677233.1 hypothetical protein LMG24238_02427 [Paraburkholderia sediminicola]